MGWDENDVEGSWKGRREWAKLAWKGGAQPSATAVKS